MKVVTYELEKMERVGKLLNEVTVHGVHQARILTEIGNIIDSGQPGEIYGTEEIKDGVEHKEVCED